MLSIPKSEAVFLGAEDFKNDTTVKKGRHRCKYG